MIEFLAELFWPWLCLGLANEVPDSPFALALLHGVLLTALGALFLHVCRLRGGGAVCRFRGREPGNWKIPAGDLRGWRRIRSVAAWLLAGAAAGISLNLLFNLLAGLVRRLAGLGIAARALSVGGGAAGVLAVFRIFLLMPAVEELVFRGLGYGKLREVMGAAPASALTAIWFGLSHGVGAGGIYAGILGIFLAIARERKGLWRAFLLHAGANAGSLMLWFLTSGG
jgi:membrane protease YdiL (CAAX protease family)